MNVKIRCRVILFTMPWSLQVVWDEKLRHCVLAKKKKNKQVSFVATEPYLWPVNIWFVKQKQLYYFECFSFLWAHLNLWGKLKKSYQALNISFQFGQISDYKVIKLVQISCQVSAGKSVNISGSTEQLH